jgi:predicted nucleic acid-binding Zn ribbon protein
VVRLRGTGPDGEAPGPRPVNASLDEVSRRLGMKDARGLGGLFAHWEELVGPALAAHVKPVRLDTESLVVAVDHPAWATQVRQMGDDLLDRVAGEIGVARPARLEIRVRR